jgi:hypothetical protein
MNVYGSGGWQSAGSAVNGTSDRNTYTATAGQTVFAATYDTGYVDVYLNGVKLISGTDFTATNGTSITLTTGAAVNDVVDIVAYGTFVVADHYTKLQSDARYVAVTGDTMTGNLDVQGTITSDGLTVDTTDNTIGFTKTNLGSFKLSLSSKNYTTISLLADSDGTPQDWLLSAMPQGPFRIWDETNSAERLRVDTTGDISFYDSTGTTPKFVWDSSAESLELTSAIAGAGGWNEALTLQGSYPMMALNETGTSKHSRIGNNADGGFQFYVNGTSSNVGTNALNIDSSGNVGIGTSATTAGQVTIQGSGAPRQLVITDDGTEKLQIFQIGNDATIEAASGGSNSTNLIFKTASSGSESEAMRIDSSGNLLVGKTVTDGATVGSELRKSGFSVFTRDSSNPMQVRRLTNDGNLIEFKKDGSTVGSIGSVLGARLRVDSNSTAGYLGIAGTDRYYWNNTEFGVITDNAYNLGSSGARFTDGHFSGTVNAANFNTTSDATLKTNVETLSGSLDAVKSLRGVSFDWIENGNSDVGVIAQEVEAVLPDVVSTNDQGIKSVKYGNMVALLIEAMKEQQAQIDELKAQLNS